MVQRKALPNRGQNGGKKHIGNKKEDRSRLTFRWQLRGANMGDFFNEFDDMGMGDPSAMMGGPGGPGRRARPVMSEAERQARVAAKTKARKKSKSASKARKKNRKRK